MTAETMLPELPDALYVVVGTDDDGLTAINYFAAGTDLAVLQKRFPGRKVEKYLRAAAASEKAKNGTAGKANFGTATADETAACSCPVDRWCPVHSLAGQLTSIHACEGEGCIVCRASETTAAGLPREYYEASEAIGIDEPMPSRERAVRENDGR